MAPIKKYSAGSISCALWENEIPVGGRTVRALKVTVERRYKDKDGQWKSSGSFSRNEIPLVQYVLGKAFEAAAGEAQATAIRARASRASKQILAFASAKATKIKAEGDSAAAKYYREYAKNEQLGMFLRSLESLRKELMENTQIVLDGSQIPAVKFFREGPSLEDVAPSIPADPSDKKK